MCTNGGAELTDNSNEITHKNISEVPNAKPDPPADMSAAVNRQYKDRLFKFLFGNPEHKEWTLSLYNAVNGTDYNNPDDISAKNVLRQSLELINKLPLIAVYSYMSVSGLVPYWRMLSETR